MLQPMPPLLESNAIHAMEVGKKAGYGLFLIPSPGNQTCVLVSWAGNTTTTTSSSSSSSSTSSPPLVLRDDATPDEIKASITANYPLLGEPTDVAVAQLLAQRPSEAQTVRCNRYHWLRPRGSGRYIHTPTNTYRHTYSHTDLDLLSNTHMYTHKHTPYHLHLEFGYI